jgi:hypothetical protein
MLLRRVGESFSSHETMDEWKKKGGRRCGTGGFAG